MFGIKPKTLHHWYKEELSGYPQAIAAKTWDEKRLQIVDNTTGELIKEKPVHIAKPANMGSKMGIDEKQIGKKMYTIMTNNETGKIALLTPTLKVDELTQAMVFLKESSHLVTSISCDMGPSYIKFCRDNFPTAQIVIDKFHVIKQLLDGLQEVRKNIKTNLLNTPEPKESTGTEAKWTTIELLKRSRYILCKMQIDWDDDEKEMMAVLFAKFEQLKTAYCLTQTLRNWYNNKNIGKTKNAIEKELYNWCDEVLASKIPELTAAKKMIERHQDNIINYFTNGQTNAKAENMNGKIQRFLATNFGVRNRDFFLYRVAKYFS